MIDTSAFAEWLVAKAEKRGATLDDANIRVAREAAEAALARDGDDVHVACTLAGAEGPVQIDECMTRTAIEVLFPKVERHGPERTYEPTRAQKRTVRVEKPRREEGLPAAKGPPWSLVIALALLVVGFAIAFLVEHASKERPEAPAHDKREMRH